MIVRIVLGILVLSIITIVIFVFSTPHANTPNETEPVLPVVTPAVPAVSMSDVYKKGTRTITGSFEVPTPCTVVSAESTLENEPTQRVLVLLTVLEDKGICLQEKTKQSFTTSIVAGEGLPIRVLVNGVEATTTLL
jgi:hypothetical protein